MLRTFSTPQKIGQYEAGMNESMPDNVGKHPTEGECPLEGLIAIAYQHTHWHIGDIRQALELSD